MRIKLRKKEFVCKNCNIIFSTYLNGRTTVKYCSPSCSAMAHRGKNNNRYNEKLHSNEQISCECGCGALIYKYSPGKINRFEHGHNSKIRGQTKETKKKLSKMRTGKGNQMYNIRKYGKDAPNYSNGNTPLYKLIRHLKNNIEWRKSVFKRDNYLCQKCYKKGKYLNVHHIKNFAMIIIDNNIKTIEEAVKCDELWDLNNGITLCEECHNKTKGGENDHYKPK